MSESKFKIGKANLQLDSFIYNALRTFALGGFCRLWLALHSKNPLGQEQFLVSSTLPLAIKLPSGILLIEHSSGYLNKVIVFIAI